MSTTGDSSGLQPCRRIGFDVAAPIFSQSVALFVVTDDGSSAVSARWCAYPDAGVGWLWVHVLTPDRSWSYNVDHLAAPGDRVDAAGAGVDYRTAGDEAVFARTGPLAAPSSGECRIDARLHAGAEAPDEPGDVTVGVHGSFTPSQAGGGTLPGRTELFGAAVVELDVDGERMVVAGRAQWHEQEQEAPRFVVPFTYATLRGPELSFIGLVGPRASGGFSRGPGLDLQLTEVRIPLPEAGHHAVQLHDAEGRVLSGEVGVRHSFTIPVYGRPWWGTVVAGEIDGRAVSGTINRWRFGLH